MDASTRPGGRFFIPLPPTAIHLPNRRKVYGITGWQEGKGVMPTICGSRCFSLLPLSHFLHSLPITQNTCKLEIPLAFSSTLTGIDNQSSRDSQYNRTSLFTLLFTIGSIFFSANERVEGEVCLSIPSGVKKILLHPLTKNCSPYRSIVHP